MKLTANKRNGLMLLIATSLTSIGVASSFAMKGVISLVRTNADTVYTLTLNSNNSPTLSAGEGTKVDTKGVTWEYHNAADYNSGHVKLNHQGYMGVSSSTSYGFSGITGITVNYSVVTTAELWLLTSCDGVNWNEQTILESGTASSLANKWRFVRLYNYSVDSDPVNINSVIVDYSCSGISATEDLDSAKVGNVRATSSNLTYSQELNDLSPNSIGGEAVRFEKTDTVKSDITIGFDKNYTISEIKNSKIEFDMYTVNINYGKTIQMVNGTSTYGIAIDSSKSSSYKVIPISGDWYHIEVAINSLVSTISGYGTKDIPDKNIETKIINGIKINAGSCIIDNLRIGSSSYELGNYNNPTYKPYVGEFFWFKVSWVGVLHPEQVVITFSDDTIGRHVPLTDTNLKNGSPFYIEWLTTGTVTVTATVVSGYNRQSQTIQKSITITATAS